MPGVIFNKDQIELTDTGVNKFATINGCSPKLVLEARSKKQIDIAIQQQQMSITNEHVALR